MSRQAGIALESISVLPTQHIYDFQADNAVVNHAFTTMLEIHSHRSADDRLNLPHPPSRAVGMKDKRTRDKIVLHLNTPKPSYPIYMNCRMRIYPVTDRRCITRNH